jgi:hypothetical protein
VHESKHDGYRLQVRRDGDAARLFTRRGYDWALKARLDGGSKSPDRRLSFGPYLWWWLARRRLDHRSFGFGIGYGYGYGYGRGW